MDTDLARSIPALQTFHSEHAFLIARIDGGEAGRIYLSTQPETRRKRYSRPIETPRKAHCSLQRKRQQNCAMEAMEPTTLNYWASQISN